MKRNITYNIINGISNALMESLNISPIERILSDIDAEGIRYERQTKVITLFLVTECGREVKYNIYISTADSDNDIAEIVKENIESLYNAFDAADLAEDYYFQNSLSYEDEEWSDVIADMKSLKPVVKTLYNRVTAIE